MSVRSYNTNCNVETNLMCVDEYASTLPETKDQYVFTVTENGMQTRTGVSQPSQMPRSSNACVEMQTCHLQEEANMHICEFMTQNPPMQINTLYDQTLPYSCGSLGSIEKRMSKTNRILKLNELPSQTDPPRQTQHTETLCTCTREPCDCNFGKCDVNDKLTATFESSQIQTEPKTAVNTTQMCCCFNSNCGTCECIFNDAKKNKLTTAFEETMAQTTQIQRPLTEDAFISCKPDVCEQCTDRLFPCQESDCQTKSKEIRSTSTGTYACVCEYCNCGEEMGTTGDEMEESGEDEPYCTCRTGYCCCNQDNGSTSHNEQHSTPKYDAQNKYR